MDKEKDSITNGAGTPSPNTFTGQENTVMVPHPHRLSCQCPATDLLCFSSQGVFVL